MKIKKGQIWEDKTGRRIRILKRQNDIWLTQGLAARHVIHHTSPFTLRKYYHLIDDTSYQTA